MHRHKFKSAREVDVDECYVCGGLFLDSGELKAIETGSLSEEEAQDYYEKLVSEMPVYKEAERELMQKKLDAEAGQVRADAMRFLTGIYNFNR
jgi:Zn-finger nucleic acid-binding protein